jgi:hypothetical protein
MRKVVEKKLAEGRVAAAKTKNGREQNAHPQKGGKSRDLAAERVGLGAGDKAEAALKALKAADAAEASGIAVLKSGARNRHFSGTPFFSVIRQLPLLPEPGRAHG